MLAQVTFPFTLQFRLNREGLSPGDLVRMGDSLRVLIREAGADPSLAEWDRAQNYLRYRLPDGRPLVLEVAVAFDTQNSHRRTMRIGCPLARLASLSEHQVTIRGTSALLELMVDGEVQDEEWPTDPLLPWEGEPEIIPPAGQFSTQPSVQIGQKQRQNWPIKSIQYFTPPGHNAWVGDTMCLTHDGVFHLFYLFDRRHGSSKFGCGGHQVAHASSRDLRTWTHHPLALAITDPWMTYGTGMPIVRDGQILLFFGLHTDRIVPRDQTCVPEIEATLARIGWTQPIAFMRDGRFPMGSAIAYSRDGVEFTVDRTIIHHCQNPSPFIDPTTGRVYLLAGYGDEGCYETDDLRHWQLVDKHFLPNVKDTPQGNTLECQCFFEWNGWYYLIAGRTGFWMSRRPLGPYWHGAKGASEEQVSRPRWDPYDGLWVPTVASWEGTEGNRRILAGWIAGPDVEWAGHLVFREFVQHEDGTLGTKWPEEMIPPTGEPIRPAQSMTVKAAAGFTQLGAGRLPESCRIAVELTPSGAVGSFGVRIGACELKFSPDIRRAQWHTARSPTPTSDLPVLEEILAQEPYNPIWSNPHRNIPFKGGDFAIQNVEGLDRRFLLDLIVLYDPKSDSTIIDACIDNRRTMITRRPGQRAGDLKLFAYQAEVDFHNLIVRPLL